LQSFELVARNGDRTTTQEFDSSLVVGRSEQNGHSVVIAVLAPRSVEPAIFGSLHEEAKENPISIFRGDELSPGRDAGAFRSLIDANSEYLYAAYHQTDQPDGPEWNRLQAVQAAVLIDDLLVLDPEALVLVSGGADRAQRIGSALTGLRERVPPIEYCTQAHRYYPTAHLAQLAATHCAHQAAFHSLPDVYYNITFKNFKARHHDRWGDAHSARIADNYEPDWKATTTAYAENPEDRLYCWFSGHVSHGDASDTIQIRLDEIRRWARPNGQYRLDSICRSFQ
jgi:hypothetical protein